MNTTTATVPSHYEMPVRHHADMGYFVEAGDGVRSYSPRRRKSTAQTGTFRYDYDKLVRASGGLPTMRKCPQVGSTIVMFANHKQCVLRVTDVTIGEPDAHGCCGWARLVLVEE